MILIYILSVRNNAYKFLFVINVDKWFLSCQSSIRKQACSSGLAFWLFIKYAKPANIVKYPSQNGEKDVIDVFLTKGQVFKTGEKVKIDMKYVGWGGISINYNTVDHIEKVHEINNSTQNNDDVWIWS